MFGGVLIVCVSLACRAASSLYLPIYLSTYLSVCASHVKFCCSGAVGFLAVGLTWCLTSVRCCLTLVQLDEARPGAGLAIGVADMSSFYPTLQNLGVGEGSWCYSKTGQASIGGNTGFSDYGETFTHGCVVGLVLDMDAGTLRFVKDGSDQGIASCTGLRGRVLTPGIVMGTNKGGKRTKVTVLRSGEDELVLPVVSPDTRLLSRGASSPN
jgi:hypothetical protein